MFTPTIAFPVSSLLILIKLKRITRNILILIWYLRMSGIYTWFRKPGLKLVYDTKPANLDQNISSITQWRWRDF